MNQAVRVMRVILNMPEPKVPAQATPQTATQSEAGVGQTGESSTSTAPATPATPAAVAPSATPWEHEDETGFTVWGRRALRTLLVFVLGLAALTGVRQWVHPRSTSVTTAPDASTQFPQQEASAVAARFVTAYLSWDEENPSARRDALALDLPAAVDSSAGWSGDGKQTVRQVEPAGVEVESEDRARVTVLALVTPYEQRGSKWVGRASTWTAVQVPVGRSGGRVVVTGEPGAVALPEPQQPAASNNQQPDSALSTATQADANAFFTAYAAGSPDALSAPGVHITGLDGAVTLQGLTSWVVYAGSDPYASTRPASAVVSWSTSTGAVLEQSYTLELTRVSSTSGDRWQVSAIHGGR